jgi:hypothetical protein
MINRDATTETVPDPAARAMLDALVREHGLETFAYFFVTGEGQFLPNGMETASGYVIGADGRIFGFWTGWDGDGDQPCFRIWRSASPEPRWERSREYQRARQAVGLS